MESGAYLTEFSPSNGFQYPSCVRCRGEITSGHAYELGDDRWHTHCFSCYRCEKPLSCDSDFLVLGTGTLICFDCSDSCRSCGKKIDDLAIILSSSNEAYCSDCFKCCKCGSKIRDLKYAKTRKGLFCISCHEKLLEKRRYYEERKRRLKKDLPELPPELGTPPTIPEKSPRRPQYEQPQQSMKSNSESVISQYLDDVDSRLSNGNKENTEPLGTEDSKISSTQESLGSERDTVEISRENQQGIDTANSDSNSRRNRNYHKRQVSIDDILNSTLEEPDSFGLRNTKGGLSRTPLRNQDSSENLVRSPIQFRRGIVVNGDDDDNEGEDIDDDEIKVEEGFEKREVFRQEPKQLQPIPKLPQDDISELTIEEERLPVENKGLALNLPSPKKDEDTLTLGLDEIPKSPSSQTKQVPPPSSLQENKATPENRLTSPQPKSTVSKHTPTLKNSPQFSSKPVLSSPSIKLSHSPRQPAPTSTSGSSTPGISSSANAGGTSQGSSTSGNNLNQINTNGEEKSRGGGSKLGRSLSMKSKNLVQNIRSRTTGILDPKPISSSPPQNKEKLSSFAFPSSQSSHSISDTTTKAESDTHTGWGVSNEKTSVSRSSSMHRTTPRGKSDSNLHPEPVSPRINHSKSNSSVDHSEHRRTRSHASVSSSTATNVSMYRTPPLEGNSVFGRVPNSSAKAHHRNFSWQAANETVKEEDSTGLQDADMTTNSETSENEHFLKKELTEAELSLRKMKLELRELDSKKRHLNSDVDHLKVLRDGLTRDIEGLKSEKERYILESLDQLQQQQREQKDHQHPQKEQQREQPQHPQRHHSASPLSQQQYHQYHQSHQSHHTHHHHHQEQTSQISQHSSQQQQPSLSSSSLAGSRQQDNSIDDIPPTRQADTASIVRPASKPRFWKIFSGGGRQAAMPTNISQHQHQHHNPQSINNNLVGSPSMNSGGSNNNSKLEISNPVLQNPNEFSDMKLFPITNSNSESSSRASPVKNDGAVLYGSNLVSRCAYEQNYIPMIVTVCTKHIEDNENYMKAEGIYRKSGSQLLIEEIERAFSDCYSKPSPELLKLMDEDIHAVASVLKRYLRKLPNPVLTFQIYEPLIRLVRDNKLLNNVPLKNGGNTEKTPQYLSALEFVTKILKNLPREHYDLLRYLSQHIGRITSYSEWNLMNLYNLSLVFAPGLIRDYNGDRDILDMKERNYIVGFLLGNYKDIFD